jgi:hypothetical protein
MQEAWQNGQYELRKFFLDCLTFEDGIGRLTRNVSNYQSTLRYIPKGEGLKEVSVTAANRF